MRIIQSAWSCNQPDLLTANSGWLAPEYNLMAWTLSCLQLKNYYSDVVLYCDNVYAKMLIDTLQLPYSDVVCNLDVLNTYHPQLWALPKIHAYSQQEEPFLHIDGDVFIWKQFEDSLLKCNLIAQNMESATEYYGKIMESLESELTYFPKEIIKERQTKSPILAYNAGIFGGTDVSFFKEYTTKAFEFVDKNYHNLSKINISNFNVFFEQYLFYCLAKERKQNVSVLISDIIGDNQYKGFGDFAKVPFEKQYLHLLGQYKGSNFICTQLANRLRQDYPLYYYRIIELFKKRKVSLFKDYYSFDNCSQKDLVSRYNELKIGYATNNLTKEINSIGQLRFNRIINTDCFIEKNKKKALNEEELKDLEFFCRKINSILKSKFSLIAIDYLYARDLNVNQYFQYLFEDIENIYSKKIIADDTIEIIESEYDWSSFFEKRDINESNAIPVKNASQANTVIVPECESGGFTIESIDDLDLILLKILEETKTVQELLNELSHYFDESELNKSKKEFEKLIFGRIKQGIHMKSIRVLY